jgi:hypothetical protein
MVRAMGRTASEVSSVLDYIKCQVRLTFGSDSCNDALVTFGPETFQGHDQELRHE